MGYHDFIVYLTVCVFLWKCMCHGVGVRGGAVYDCVCVCVLCTSLALLEKLEFPNVIVARSMATDHCTFTRNLNTYICVCTGAAKGHPAQSRRSCLSRNHSRASTNTCSWSPGLTCVCVCVCTRARPPCACAGASWCELTFLDNDSSIREP